MEAITEAFVDEMETAPPNQPFELLIVVLLWVMESNIELRYCDVGSASL